MYYPRLELNLNTFAVSLIAVITVILIFAGYIFNLNAIHQMQVDDLNKQIATLKSANSSANSFAKGSKYINFTYNFTLNIPADWAAETTKYDEKTCGSEILDADGKPTGNYIGKCEEIVFVNSKNPVEKYYLIVTADGGSTNFDRIRGGIRNFSFKKEDHNLTMLNVTVDRYKLTSPDGEGHLGYSYNAVGENELQDFTGEIKIGDLKLGAFTNNTEESSVEVFEKVLSSFYLR